MSMGLIFFFLGVVVIIAIIIDQSPQLRSKVGKFNHKRLTGFWGAIWGVLIFVSVLVVIGFIWHKSNGEAERFNAYPYQHELNQPAEYTQQPQNAMFRTPLPPIEFVSRTEYRPVTIDPDIDYYEVRGGTLIGTDACGRSIRLGPWKKPLTGKCYRNLKLRVESMSGDRVYLMLYD